MALSLFCSLSHPHPKGTIDVQNSQKKIDNKKERSEINKKEANEKRRERERKIDTNKLMKIFQQTRFGR
jgi:hypothetical protein